MAYIGRKGKGSILSLAAKPGVNRVDVKLGSNLSLAQQRSPGQNTPHVLLNHHS